MTENLQTTILEILDKELSSYSEGCIGSSCIPLVIGKEKAAKIIVDLINAEKKD